MGEELETLDEAVVTASRPWWQRHPVLLAVLIAGGVLLLLGE